MKLWTLNKWLRRAGLVIVVQTDADGVEDTELWLERAKTYDARTRHAPASGPFTRSWIDCLPNFREWMGERIVLSASQREQILKDAFGGKKR